MPAIDNNAIALKTPSLTREVLPALRDLLFPKDGSNVRYEESTFQGCLSRYGISISIKDEAELLKPSSVTLIEAYPELKSLDFDPHTAPIKGSFRIYVSDGAYFQHEEFSASSWALALAGELCDRSPALEISVRCLTYPERAEIDKSARAISRLICEDIKSDPLKPFERILLLGHSQGAFILSYLLKQHDYDPSFCMEMPWDNISGLVTVDPPLAGIREYSGPGASLLPGIRQGLVERSRLIGKIVEVIYPAGKDYLESTEALSICESPAEKEIRNIRTNSKGEPLYIKYKSGEIDNPGSNWSHHPFLEKFALSPQNIEIRKKFAAQIWGLIAGN